MTGFLGKSRRGLLAGAASIITLTAAAAAQAQAGGQVPRQAAGEAARAFAIAPQPLASALTAFGIAADMEVTYPAGLIGGVRSPGASGTQTPLAALSQLLAGTGFTYRMTGPTSVTLAPVPKAEGAEVLPPVNVEGVKPGSAAAGYRVGASSLAGFGDRPLLETPFSVRIVPQDLLLNRGVAEIDDLDKFDASISGSAAAPGWYSQPSIRGFTLHNWSNYRLNGLTIVNQQATGLENKERVEVLKGLSALQAGFAAPGGLINYVTKRPTAEPVTDVHSSATEHGAIKAHVDMSRKVSERFALRLNGVIEEERTHVEKARGPRQFVSAAFDLRPGPDTLITLDVEHERRDQINQPTIPLDVTGAVPRMPNPRTFLGQTWASYPTRNSVISGKVEHKLDERWTVSAEMNYVHLHRDQNSLSLGSLRPNGEATALYYLTPDQTRESANARLMVRGRFDTGGIGHDLAVGYGRQWLRARWGDGFYGAIGTTNIYAPRPIAQPAPAIDRSSVRGRWSDQSFFINDVVAFGPKWDLHLGGRYALIDRRNYNGTGRQTSRYNEGVFTPSAALVFKPLPGVAAYVSYIEGLEEGGTAPTGARNANEVLDPRVSKQIEAGVKADIGGVTLESSVFRISRTGEFTNAANYYVQDGRQTHLGWEAAVTGRVTPELTVIGSLMLLDAELTRTGVAATEGKRPRSVPDHRAALIAEYAPHALEGWSFNGYWSRTGRQAVNDTNRAFIDSFDVFGAGARYETDVQGTPVTIRANIDNIFDARYWAAAQFGSLVPGAPRTAYASVSVKF